MIHAESGDWVLYHGDAREVLKTLPAHSVHLIVTSPPYFQQRDYGSGGMGQEDTVQEYLDSLLEIVEQMRRVLRRDGSLWLNLGDTYQGTDLGRLYRFTQNGRRYTKPDPGIVRKSLALVPHRAAIALQDAGWIIRADVIWAKPNPMPESIKDRPVQSHEHVLMLTTSPRCFYDAWAGREQAVDQAYIQRLIRRGYDHPDDHMRYRRNVWTVPTEPISHGHFATFPLGLIEPIIKLGTSEGGVCSGCGTPRPRVLWQEKRRNRSTCLASSPGKRGVSGGVGQDVRRKRSLGFVNACSCGEPSTAATVLDPFCGSGTALLAAQKLGRYGIGIDLHQPHLERAEARLLRAMISHR